MNLNANERVSSTPDIAHERSRMIKPYKHTTSMNAGKLVPFYLEDALPGSTYNLNTSFHCRMMTPIAPVMDEAYLDVFYFFVPYRLLWDHWREFYGENRSGYWAQQVQYNVPRLYKDDDLHSSLGSVWDHFALPLFSAANDESYASAFPFRAYCMIWNEWFRNENTDNPTYIYTGDNDLHTSSGSSALYGGELLDVTRMHDYFSDCLPTAQKLAMPVTIPLIGDERAPVYPMDGFTFEGNTPPSYVDEMHWTMTSADIASNHFPIVRETNDDNDDSVAVSFGQPYSAPGTYNNYTYPNNLWADFSNVSGVTINALREAIAVQRYAERLALGGSRYSEQLATFYGLTTQDSRLQRPEFLGSQRFRINMSQVLQTSETGTTPQGTAAGFSVTGGYGAHVTYSTQEHGLIMGLCCIRHDRSYQQGVHREWLRRDLFDFYQPPFAHLGNQAVTTREIRLTANKTLNDNIFGYQEAWAEYRYKPSDISGYMRSGITGSLDIWHYGDWYSSAANPPTLSEEWMREGDTEIARTLAVVDDDMTDQFMVQFSVPTDVVAPIPLYSVPGMMDHF